MNEHSCSQELASTGFTCKNQSGWERQHSRSGVNVQRQRWANWHVSFPCCITVSYLLVGLISGSSVDWDPFFCWVLPWGSWWGEKGRFHTQTHAVNPLRVYHTQRKEMATHVPNLALQKKCCVHPVHTVCTSKEMCVGGYVFRYCATLQFTVRGKENQMLTHSPFSRITFCTFKYKIPLYFSEWCFLHQCR